MQWYGVCRLCFCSSRDTALNSVICMLYNFITTGNTHIPITSLSLLCTKYCLKGALGRLWPMGRKGACSRGWIPWKVEEDWWVSDEIIDIWLHLSFVPLLKNRKFLLFYAVCLRWKRKRLPTWSSNWKSEEAKRELCYVAGIICGWVVVQLLAWWVRFLRLRELYPETKGKCRAGYHSQSMIAGSNMLLVL